MNPFAPWLWLILPSLAGLALGIVLAIPSPRYAPDYRPSAAASLAYLVSATFGGLLAGFALFFDAADDFRTRSAAECFAVAKRAAVGADEARWCIVHPYSTLLQLQDDFPRAVAGGLTPVAESFATCFRARNDYDSHRRCFVEHW